VTPILSLSAADLESWLAARDAPAYRRRQIWGWLARGAESFEEMRDIPKALRAELDRDFRATSLKAVASSQADGGRTTKTLYELDGGHSVEAVVMRYTDRSTLCISSQAGCPIGCPFCATGRFPFGRNLKSHEIVEQAVDSALSDRAHLGRRDGEEIGGEGQRLAVEVAVGFHLAVLEHDRVVDRRVELYVRRATREVQRVARRARHLRAAADRVGILHRVLGVAVGDHHLRPVHQLCEIGRACHLPRVRPDLLQA
jgi:hypothetical protein